MMILGSLINRDDCASENVIKEKKSFVCLVTHLKIQKVKKVLIKI